MKKRLKEKIAWWIIIIAGILLIIRILMTLPQLGCPK
jgi:hypothetical protein